MNSPDLTSADLALDRALKLMHHMFNTNRMIPPNLNIKNVIAWANESVPRNVRAEAKRRFKAEVKQMLREEAIRKWKCTPKKYRGEFPQ